MGEDEGIFIYGVDGFADGLSGFGCLVEADGGVAYSDGSTDGAAYVRDDYVCSGFGHGGGFFWCGNVGDGEEVHFAGGELDAVDFLLDTHVCFFERLSELTVDDGMGGEVVDAGEAHVLYLFEEMPHASARVGGVDSADDGDFIDDGEDFEFSDFHGDGVGVAVCHHAGDGACASHAEASGCVDDDEVCAAFFDELCGDA